MTDAENPRAVIGGNYPPLARSIAAEQGDFAAVTTAFLEDEYAKQPQIASSLLAEARALPESIEDDKDKGRYASLIKRIRDHAKSLSAFHEKEKQPYLRGGQAVDQFFFGLIDKLSRRDKKAKAGAADVLLARLNDYDTRKLEEERARLRREAQEREQAALQAQRIAAEQARAAEAAALAAERARKPEIIEEKAAAAEQQAAVAQVARVDATLATLKAEEASIATIASPAELMRRRGEDGTLSTMATEPYAVVEDETLLDKEKLWPFIALDAKEKALRSWARTTNHSQPMAGAKIGKRPRSVVR